MMRRLVRGLPLGFSILAVAIAIGAYVNANKVDTTRTQFLRTSDEAVVLPPEAAQELARTLDEVQEAKRDVESASNSASIILSFIEGGSILIGALIALAVLAFGASIQDVRSQLDQSIQEARTRLDATEERMGELVKQIQAQVEESIHNGEMRLQSSEKRMEELNAHIQNALKDTESTMQTLHNVVHEAVENAKQEAENAFRVLSLLLLAEQQVRARNRQSAIAALQEAYQIDPTNQTTNYLLGYLYTGRKQFDKAVEHLQYALDRDANFAPALAAMGLAQRRMGDAETDEMKRRKLYAQAELNITKALETDPGLIDADNESYFGTLGGLYRRQGRNEDALKAYEDAVRITPNSSYPVGNLAMLYKKLGYEDKAQATYKRAIEIAEAVLDDQPGDTWARLDLAQALLVNNQKAKALSQYRNVISRISEPAPLETALGGLEFLMDAPTPIDGIDEASKLLKDAIARLQQTPPKFEA